MRFIACLIGCLISIGIACAGEVEPMLLRTYGADKPDLIYVFTSASCPHCAYYHHAILPTLKKEFVDTGLAQLKIVDMPYDTPALQAMQIGRCMDDTAYASFMKQVYDNQAVWGFGQNPKRVLTEYAGAAGLTEAEVEACLSDTVLRARIMEQRDNLADLYRVRGLPTTVVITRTKSEKWAGTDDDEIRNGVRRTLMLQ